VRALLQLPHLLHLFLKKHLWLLLLPLLPQFQLQLQLPQKLHPLFLPTMTTKLFLQALPLEESPESLASILVMFQALAGMAELAKMMYEAS
jgi:hypothetical protein